MRVNIVIYMNQKSLATLLHEKMLREGLSISFNLTSSKV